MEQNEKMCMTDKSRELYFDLAKAVLMFFVINGHLPAANIIAQEAVG